MITGASDKLRQWLEMGSITISQYEQAVMQLGERPDGKTWQVFFNLLTFVLGVGALVFSVLFVIAFNWDDMSRMAKFALVEGALVLAVFGYFYRIKVKKDNGIIAGWCLMAIALLIGGLLALFGQVYQTGADSWQLFFNWSLFITPIALVSRFTPLWGLWLLLANLTMFLYFDQIARGAYGNDVALWYCFHIAFITGCLGLCEWLKHKHFAFKPESLNTSTHIGRVMFLVCIFVLLYYWIDSSWRSNSAEILLPVWLVLAMVYFRFRTLDIFKLGVCLVMSAFYLSYLVGRHFYNNIGSIEAMFINSSLLLIIGIVGTLWLRSIANDKLEESKQVEFKQAESEQAEFERVESEQVEKKQVPSLWQQMINLNIVNSDAIEPKTGMHGIAGTLALFSILGIFAGLFFIFGLFTLVDAFQDSIVFLSLGFLFCMFLFLNFSQRIFNSPIYYVPAVLTLMMTMLFYVFAVINLRLEESTSLLFGTAIALVLMWFVEVKSLRFMLFVIASSALLRLGYIFEIEVLFLVVANFAWLYMVFNEQQLFARFNVTKVMPVSHGILVMLLTAGFIGQEQYQLFGGAPKTFTEYLPFLLVSCGALFTLILCSFVIAKRQGFSSFSKLVVATLLISILLFSVPLVSISLSIMLCGLYLQRRAWLMIGSLSVLYFVGYFYYDLEATLDAKALYLALFGLGVITLRYEVKHSFKDAFINNKEAV